MKIQKPFLLVTSLLLLPNASQAQTEWTGATDGNWDTTTDNWTGGTGSLYTAGDAVEFGDSTATANLTISLAGSQSPSSVTFTDTGAGTNAYIFNTNAISGAGSLTLNSGFDGSVRLNVDNDYAGATNVNGGTLILGNTGGLGNGALNLNGGALTNTTAFDPGTAITNAIQITGTNTLYAGANLFLAGDITGDGTLNVGGSSGSSATIVVTDNLDGFTGTLAYDDVQSKNNLRFDVNVDTTAKFSTTGGGSNRNLNFNGGGTSTIGELSGDGGRLQGNGTLNVNQSTDTVMGGRLQGGLQLEKSGAGSLTLSNSNAHSGGTKLTAGTLVAGNNDAFGGGAVELAGGILTNTGVRAIGNEINISGTTLIEAANGANFTLNGALTGSGTLNVGRDGAGSASVIISNDLSGFSGTVNFTNVGGGNNLTFDSAVNTTAKFTTTQSSGTNRFLRFNENSTIGELSGADGALIVGNGKTLTINQSTNTTYGGSIGISTVNGGIEKAGAGTLTLTGASAYINTTTVSGGTLSAENNKALGNTTAVTVGGGTLDVRGLTAGTLTLGGDANLELTSGTIAFDLGTAFDQIVSSGAGAFDITGGTFALNLGSGFDYGDTYEVLSGFGGSNSVSGLSFTGYDDVTYTASLDTSGFLSFTPVPEPSALALLGFSVLGFCARRRRQA